MKLREITPKEYYCTAAACPAIFEITPKDYQCAAMACPTIYEIMGKDKLVIVGHKVDNPEKLGIADRIGKDEQAIIIDKEMLRKIFEK
ncbi:MAG: hypothetical protein ACOZAL_01575 [Patescibacteria group bacterium]